MTPEFRNGREVYTVEEARAILADLRSELTKAQNALEGAESNARAAGVSRVEPQAICAAVDAHRKREAVADRWRAAQDYFTRLHGDKL